MIQSAAMFATCSWPSLCEQSELQCWRRNRRLCGPVQISAAKALPLTFNISIMNTQPLAASVFLQEQGNRQGTNGKHRPLVFRSCRVPYPSPLRVQKTGCKNKNPIYIRCESVFFHIFAGKIEKLQVGAKR